ncbi:MAG: DUF2927 domain-containing protein [Pseudomonadota bacterium]
MVEIAQAIRRFWKRQSVTDNASLARGTHVGIQRSRLGGALVTAAVLSGCATIETVRTTPYTPGERPSFAPPLLALSSGPVQRPNDSLAVDFVDLTTRTEYYHDLPGLAKLREPIEIRLATPGFEPYVPFLRLFAEELRRETGANIHLRPSPSPAASQIHLTFVQRGEFDLAGGSVLCFFDDGKLTIQDWLTRDRTTSQWGTPTPPRDVTVFIPIDTVPADVLGCFYEEITQTLGPTNDLYRLPDSIFNDENAHFRPTPFDLLMLEVLYDERMKPGMARNQAQKIARTVLRERNPEGETSAGPLIRQDRDLDDFWRAAHTADLPRDDRIEALDQALTKAKALPPDDYRALALEHEKALFNDFDEAATTKVFERLVEKYRRHAYRDPLREALAGESYADSLIVRRQFGEYYKHSQAFIPTLARNGLDLNVMNLECGLARAQNNLEPDSAKTLTHLERCVAWVRYALGTDHPTTQEWEDIVRAYRRF